MQIFFKEQIIAELNIREVQYTRTKFLEVQYTEMKQQSSDHNNTSSLFSGSSVLII